MSRHVDLFLGQHSPVTARTYARALRELEGVIGGSAEAATAEQLIAWRQTINGQAPATIARKVSTAAAFFAFLRRAGVRSDDPMLPILRPKVDRARGIHSVSADTCMRLIEACRDDRERALLWLLVHGLRIGEVVELDADSLNGDELRIVGKGGRLRVVVLEEAAAVAVRAHRGLRRTGPLLRGREGRLTTRQAQRLVASVSGRIGDEINPHALRHAFALSLVRSGVNLALVQAALGQFQPGHHGRVPSPCAFGYACGHAPGAAGTTCGGSAPLNPARWTRIG
jgi:site-specific recombinase XerD